MNITITNETDMELGFDYEEIADKVIMECLEYEAFPYEVEVDVTLVDNSTIHEINKEMRQMDAPTDVLSFPLIEYQAAGNFETLGDEDDNFNPETGDAMLGDIVISLERVISQAEEYGHSQLREYSFLIAHSMLHLMGYDHMTTEEEKEMFKRQAEILERLNINRE